MAALTMTQLLEQTKQDMQRESGRFYEYVELHRRAADPQGLCESLKQAGVPASSANLLADRMDQVLRPLRILSTDYARALVEFVATIEAVESAVKRAKSASSGFQID